MKNLLLTICIIAISAGATFAQKAAHADINAILSVMPDNKKINEDLQIYATGLSKRVEDMKAQLDGVVENFNKVLAAEDTAKALEFQQQGLELDKQYRETAAAAEQQLGQKRNELLQPVLQKIRTAMETVAKKEGYEYVLNSVDGSGTSIYLWGPEGADITRKVVAELGIKLESQQAQPTEAAPSDDKKKKK